MTVARHASFSPYVAGDQFTLADIVFYFSSGLAAGVAQRLFNLDLLADLPAAKALLATMGENPNVWKIEAAKEAGMPAFMAATRAKFAAAS